MKTMMLIFPLVGTALLASAAEPVKPETPSGDVTAMSVTKNSANPAPGGRDAADEAYDAKIGERLARSGAVTLKPKVSLAKGFLQSLNPLAPTKPAPTTPWLSRTPWGTVALEEHQKVLPSVETNREVKMRVTVWRD